LTWSTPVNLNPGTKSVPAGTTREPWITAAGNNVYVTWNDNSGYGSTQGDVYDPYIMVSNDNGQCTVVADCWNLNAPVKGVKLNLMPNSSSSWEIQDQAVGNTVYVIWRDHTPAYGVNGTVFFMMSTNAGATWTPTLDSQVPIDVSNNPSSVTGWSNGIGVSGSTVALSYLSYCSSGEQEPSPDSGSGDCNMVAAYSNNGGQSFFPQVNVSTDGTSGPITDVSSSNFAVSGPNVYVTWQDEDIASGDFQVYLSSTNGNIIQTPSLSATPVRGAVGTTVAVSGVNFLASSPITVSFAGAPVGTITSNSSGGFSTTITVPSAVAGSNSISATDGTNAASSNFNVVPNISLTPVKGSAGTSVTVTGTGFGASLAVSVVFGSSGQVASATTNSLGSFSTSFSAPASLGTNTVTATDSSSNSASANFNENTQITLSPVKGATGKTVTVTGVGFLDTATVTIDYAGSEITTATSNSTGGFSTTFTVPASVAGDNTVTASDGTNSATANYNVVSSITITPKTSAGKNSITVTVTGTGFAGDSPVTITFGGTTETTSPASIETSVTGGFTATFVVPSTTPSGSYTVQATDGSGNSATSTFKVN